MRAPVKLLLVACFLGLFQTSPLSAQEEPTDATHLFEEETRRLAESETKETRAEFDQRTKGILQYADQRPQQVGNTAQFNVLNIAANRFEKRSGILRKVGIHCYAYVEQGRSILPGTLERLVRDFDEKIYPTNRANFGTEWNPGIDGDPRVTLFFLDIHDRYNPGANQLAYTSGYFFSGDEYTREKNSNSNEREMLYLDLYPGDPSKPEYMRVVAHEFQHMIHWHHDPKENPWVNESMSQLASYLNGNGHPSQLLAFYRNPDNNLFAWSPETMVANYGQAYLFSFYMACHLVTTQEERRALTRSIVEENTDGIQGIEKAFARRGIKSSFEEVFRNFCVANYVNDPSFAGGMYGYAKYFPQMKLPLMRTHDQATVSDKGTVKLWSARAVKINLSAHTGPISVSFGGGIQVAKSSKAACNAFDVAAVLIDSKRRAPSKLEWLTVKNYQARQTLRTPAGSHDTLMLVFVNRGPDASKVEMNFARNAPPVQFAYAVNAARKGTAQRVAAVQPKATRSKRPAIRCMMEEQSSRAAPEAFTAGSTDGLNAAVEGIAIPAELDRLSGEDEQIIDSIRCLLEAGDSGPLEDFLEVYSKTNPAGKNNLASLRSKIIDLVRFEVFQNNHAELDPFIQRLLSKQ
ncbi:MAG: hypothetical protein WA705_00300 [Candidatus Ozemobacteraceae bacterium]